jgi:hypothetical protein
VLRSQNICQILKCAGGESELRQSDETRQNLIEQYTEKDTSAMLNVLGMHLMFEWI